MATMREECRQALTAALKKSRRDDTLEQAVGREMRRAGLTYQDYMEVMEMVRVRARREKVDVWESARTLSKEQEQH